MRFLLCLRLAAAPLNAHVGKDMMRFFNKLGGSSNVSDPAVYKDQSVGYYTGGNIFARAPVHTSQLATIQLPDYRAGCGGIDMFMGAFSHIGSDKLIEALKAIGSNMGSYALLLAIETMSPQIKNIITEPVENLSYGANTIRDGVNLANHTRTNPLVLPSEIAALKDLEAYLKLPHNMVAAKIKMTYSAF